jgi:glutamate:GABA antiporter
MSAWTYWTSNLPYFPAVLYFSASNILFMRQTAWAHLSNNATFYIVFSLLTLSAATLMNIVGLDIGKWLHNVGALAMWIPVGIVVVMGLIAWHRYGSATKFTLHSMTPTIHLNDIIFWSVLTFAFGGCETASFMGEEIKNPRRSIPFALLFGGVTVTLCYILGTACVLLALPSGEVSSLQGLVQAISKTASRVGFPGVLPVAAFLIALSNIGAAGAYLAAVARLPFVAGIDRFLPPAFGALHPRWKTPWVALLTQFVLGAFFILLGQAGTSVKGAYDVLVSMGVIVYFIPYLYLFAALIKLQREPAGPDVNPRTRGKHGSEVCGDNRICHDDADDCFIFDSATRRAQQAAGAAEDCRGNRRSRPGRGGALCRRQAAGARMSFTDNRRLEDSSKEARRSDGTIRSRSSCETTD